MNSPESPITTATLHSLTSSELLQRTRETALEERRIGIELLHYLLEVDRRRLFVPKFTSLHEYVVRELGYSDGAAHRRISAMRLLRTIPELDPKLRDGSVNLSTASQVQNFMMAEKRITGAPSTRKTALELVNQISGKSARETEALLAARSPRVAAVLQERPRSIDGKNVQITITLTPDLQQKLRRLRDRMAHQNIRPSLAEQLEMLADFALKKLEGGASSSGARQSTCAGIQKPEGPATNEKVTKGANQGAKTLLHEATSAHSDGETLSASRHKPNWTTHRRRSPIQRNVMQDLSRPNARTVPTTIRRQIWNRAGSRCEFRTEAGSRCTRTHLLQIDHRIPVAWGGGREPENLQLLCATHNQWKRDRLPGG
jgi:hypothetical protein